MTAIREPVSVRAWRWVRKHPAVVASTAAVFLVSVFDSVAFSSVIAGKNAELIAANAGERTARKDAQSAQTIAEANEQVARQQNELAFATLTSVAMDLQAEFEDLPRGGTVRRRLLNRSLAGFEKLADGLLVSGAADWRKMQTLWKLSDLLSETGIGDARGQSLKHC